MRIEQLQIELRPRSPAQALDLGFALLRTSPYHAYMAYAMLMLPFALLALLLTMVAPSYATLWLLIPWWFKPLIERGPLYVLSREVFGTHVSWLDAVRAWPGQLGGGWFQLLTWFRPFAAGRSLIQPVWQLENARGKVASERCHTLGANGTATSAFWFGTVCAHLEIIVQIGGLYFVLSMTASGPGGDPMGELFRSLIDVSDTAIDLWALLLSVGGAVLIGPIYTACGFALYLNRRAALEAWDIELKLRQIVRPASAVRSGRGAAGTAAMAALLCCLSLAAPTDATAAIMSYEECMKPVPFHRLPANSPEQTRVRAQLDGLYASPELTVTRCEQRWQPKSRRPKERDHTDGPDLAWLAGLLQILLIAAGIGLVGWLLYRYRAYFPAFKRSIPAVATEVGGLDIRAGSLPPKVSDEVLRLWASGEHRAALALLYRATLSRLVTDDHLMLRQGDTEGDCLRLAAAAHAAQRLSRARLDVATSATAMWQGAAYGNRWPSEAQVHACCREWDGHFLPAGGAA